MKYEFMPFSMVDSPTTCAIVFKYGCNLYCNYCYNVDLVKNTETGLDTVTVFHEIDRLRRINSQGKAFNTVEWLIFSGGEPFPYSSKDPTKTEIFGMMQYARKMGLKIGVYTNGLSDDVSFWLKEGYIDFINIDFKHSNIMKIIPYPSTPDKYLEKLRETIQNAYFSYLNYDLEYLYINSVICKGRHSNYDITKMKNFVEGIIPNIPKLFKRDFINSTGWILTPFFNDYDKIPTLLNMEYKENNISEDEIRFMLNHDCNDIRKS